MWGGASEYEIRDVPVDTETHYVGNVQKVIFHKPTNTFTPSNLKVVKERAPATKEKIKTSNAHLEYDRSWQSDNSIIIEGFISAIDGYQIPFYKKIPLTPEYPNSKAYMDRKPGPFTFTTTERFSDDESINKPKVIATDITITEWPDAQVQYSDYEMFSATVPGYYGYVIGFKDKLSGHGVINFDELTGSKLKIWTDTGNVYVSEWNYSSNSQNFGWEFRNKPSGNITKFEFSKPLEPKFEWHVVTKFDASMSKENLARLNNTRTYNTLEEFQG